MKKLIFELYDPKIHQPDIEYLIVHIRNVDREEASIVNCASLREAIELSLEYSAQVYLVKDHTGVPIWIFGIEKERKEQGYCVWCVGTEDAGRYKREFLIHSKRIVKSWVDEFEALFNYIPIDYKGALRWVEYLGASFSDIEVINGQEVVGWQIKKKGDE